MKKSLLTLALGLVALQASAATKYDFKPEIEDPIIVTLVDGLGQQYKEAHIKVKNLHNFKGDDFDITISKDGKSIIFKGKSYRRTVTTVNPETGKQKIKLALDKDGNHYRHVINQTIELPAPAMTKIRGKHKSYSNSSKYFSNYKHKYDTELIIKIRLED